MGYQIKLKEVLLEGWSAWEGNGVDDIPSKDVTLLDGRTGSVLVNSEGIGVYSARAEELYDDSGELTLAFTESPEDVKDLESFLPEKEIQEAITVYRKYLEREDSYQN